MQCPEPDRIAAYLEDKLFEEERRILEEHFAACEDCWQVFSNAVEYIAERRPGQVAGVEPGGERTVTGGIWAQRNKLTSVAALLALSLGGWWLVGESRRPADGAGEQVAAAEERPILPRLSGEKWGPRPQGPNRGVGADFDLTRAPYMQRVLEAKRAEDTRAGAPQLQALGRDYLLAGSVDNALRALEPAAAAAPGNAHVLSDLAAVYLDRGLTNANSHDVAQSIEILSRALAADSELPEARFNLALAFEAMPLPGKAAEAWKAYLGVDRGSGWAEEARSRLREMEQRAAQDPPLMDAASLRAQIVDAAAAPRTDRLAGLVARHRQEAREAFALDLLPLWSEAALAGDATTAERLASARRLAEVWQEQTDDGSLLLQVEEIARSGRADRGRFARGHRALARGMAALEAMEIDRAGLDLREARGELPAASAARAWVDLSALACEYYRLGPDDSLVAQFDALVPRAQRDEPLRAHLSWLRGMLRFRRGESQALSLLGDALAAFEHLDEADHVVWLHYVLADAHALFGDMPRAWAHRHYTLAEIPRLTHPDRAFELLLSPAIAAAYFEERPRVAAALLDELAFLRNQRAPRQAAELELWRSRIEAKLGRFEKARSALAFGSAWARRVDDPMLRRQLTAGLQTASSLVASDSSAIATLSASIDRGRPTPDFQFPRLLFERARRYRQIGEPARAAADLAEGIAWLRRPLAAAPVDALLSRRLVGGNDLFVELTSLQIEGGNDDAAFGTAELGRRWALDGETSRAFSATTATHDRLTVREIQRGLEPRSALVAFSLVGNRAVLWRIDASGSSMVRLNAAPSQLESWATQLQTELANGMWTARARHVAQLLYKALIGPARLDDEVDRLVIVPDPALDQLPFAALVDEHGRFLLEKLAIEVSPSAGSFLTARERARQLAQEKPSILALGDPRVGSQLRPELQPLPAAAAEARAVAGQYRRREVLLEQHATKGALLDRAGRHTVVHFAGHALANPIDPARSSLALAPTAGGTDTGALFAFEVSSAHFTRTRLVVLAGCDTGAGPQRAGEGTASLARAFLAAKVPAVVASLWPVNDARTAKLMMRLHERVAGGEDPAAALREAQLTMLHAKDPALRSPSTWAAFGVLGG